MGYAKELVFRAKQGKARIIVPYGDMAQSSLLPWLSDAQSRQEFFGETGRGLLPKYRIECKQPLGWVTIAWRPRDFAQAVNYWLSPGDWRIMERQWDGSYEPVPTGTINEYLRAQGARQAPTTNDSPAPSVSVSGAKTSGFKGKRKFW